MPGELERERRRRARTIADTDGLSAAIDTGQLPKYCDITLSEAIVLGLLRQGVRTFLGVFGHGSTEIGEVLRVYEEENLVKMFPVRHETAAVHAAAALRWVTGEKAAVITSIGPGALHALAGSLSPLSNGLGVWFILGDETTEDEGPNMQQIPLAGQGNYLKLFSAMGIAYSLHTPWAVARALRRGFNTVDHPFRAGPFFLLLPMNTQAALLEQFNLLELPDDAPPPPGPASEEAAYQEAIDVLRAARKIVVKIGGGARNAGVEIIEFLELCDGVAVTSPLVPGIIPFNHDRNMTVGGSKGTLSGNYAMDNADLLVALGTRFVCQSDSSRTAYPNVQHAISVNADVDDAMHYGRNIALVGDVRATLRVLNEMLGSTRSAAQGPSDWLRSCRKKRREWDTFRQLRFEHPVLYDPVWKREVLTQPAAIKTASDWARRNRCVTFYDAGDVQANGFQIVEDDEPGQTFTDTGASYMGFAVSALLATALSSRPFRGLALTGDGSFTMNPQILIDGTQHGARGCIVLLDNRRMGAISGLQQDQYGSVYATSDTVEVDYAAWANAVRGVCGVHGGYTTDSLEAALDRAGAFEGISLIHVPVYWGPDALGNMGVFGRWNVGSWCEGVQQLSHRIGL